MRKVIATYFFPGCFAPVYVCEGGDIMYPYRINSHTAWGTETTIRWFCKNMFPGDEELSKFEELFTAVKQAIS